MNAPRNTLAAMLVLLLPSAAVAQDGAAPESPQDACTVELTPVISGGQVQTTATFNRPFGEVTAIEGPEKSGLKIVKVLEGEEPTEMAAGEPRDEVPAGSPDELTDESSTFRINTSHMAPGSYDVTLSNADGDRCSGELTVKSPADGID